jgi:hypothetical protein
LIEIHTIDLKNVRLGWGTIPDTTELVLHQVEAIGFRYDGAISLDSLVNNQSSFIGNYAASKSVSKTTDSVATGNTFSIQSIPGFRVGHLEFNDCKFLVQHDQQRYEYASKSRTSESSFDESQEEKPTDFDTQRSDPIQELSQIINIFSSDNSQNDQQGYQNTSKGVPSEEQSTNFDFVNGPKRSNSNSSMEESDGNDVNKFDFKKNIRNILKSQECYLGTQIEYGKDLTAHIPGLYRLLELCKDDGSNGLGKCLTFICEFKV